MALREILSVQAASAGVMAPTVEAESETGAEAEAEAVLSDQPVSESKQSEEENRNSSPQKESLIDLNVGISAEEDNGEINKGTEHSLPSVQNHNWVGQPEVTADWMKVGQHNVKTELSLGGNKTGAKVNYVKPEVLDGVKSELDLDLGQNEGLKTSKPELNLDLGMVKPSISLGVAKQELGLDLNMEVELDLNMEVKEEPVTVKEEVASVKEGPAIVKEEPLTVKDEPVSVKEEVKAESKSQAIQFWQPHELSSVIKESNDSKAVVAAKKAWAANIQFLQDCTIRLLCVFALDR